MSIESLGPLAAAGALGITHAIEPDHVAGIASVTGQFSDSRLSALVGACFSLGHVTLVVAWLTLGYVVLGRTSYPSIFDVVGTIGVAILLGAMGAVMTIGGIKSIIHKHPGEQNAHVHLPIGGINGHDHDHTVRSYLRTGLLGALFTLSPPLSMIGFASGLFPRYGSNTVILAVGVYAVAITVVMSTLGAGVGSAFRVSERLPRLHGAGRSVAGFLVIGVAASLII